MEIGMTWQRLTTGILAILLLSAAAAAGPAQRIVLEQPAAAPDDDAKGFLKLKEGNRGDLFSIRIRRVDRGTTFGLFLETSPGSTTFSEFGQISVRGKNRGTSRGGGAGRWKANERRGDALPAGAASVSELGGRRVEVRDPQGEVVLHAFLPGAVPADDDPGGEPPTGGEVSGPRLRILATDAAFPFENVLRAIVTVSRIEIRGTSGGFQTLVSFPGGRDVDLVKLRNGIVRVLFAGDPEPDTYDAVRIIVAAKEVAIDDGGREKVFTDFKVPSGDKTGIKVFVEPAIQVVTSLTHDLVLDFDLARSFVVQGNPKTPAGIKGFHFKPVIRAVNVSAAGTLTFRVKSDNGTPGDETDDFFVGGANYEVRDTSVVPAQVVASGASGKKPSDATVDGYVFHPAVPTGTHELEVSYTDHDDEVRSVTIITANLTDLGTITLAAGSGFLQGTVTTELVTTSGDTLGFAVAGATVEATLTGDTSPTGTDTTSSLGAYRISPLTIGSYDLTAKLSGYADATASADTRIFGAPRATDVDLKLTPLTADVSGTVTDGNGAAVEGATVRAVVDFAGKDEVIAEATTDVNGAYTLSSLPTGSYELEAEFDDGTATQAGSATLDHTGGGSAATVDITIG
jgi:protocatechuate 3,4-dioxygenase beta subunit